MSYCDWSRCDPIVIAYHDNEWGVPVWDDRLQFEYLVLESMQCGLSWTLVMKKREIFRACFDNFDFEKIALYDESDVLRIMNTEGMIRSLPKIKAVINNARCFIEIRREYGTFCDFLWAFSGGKTILYNHHGDGLIPVSNALSDRVSSALKKRGFKFLGTVTVYSYLQACGIINDHGSDCPCYQKINASFPTVKKRREGERGVKQH